MPIFKQAQDYLAPIMAEHPEARPCRSGIFFAPANRIWKGLRIWRGGLNPHWLSPQWSAGMLASPAGHPNSLTCDIFPEKDSGIQWRTDFPDVVPLLCDHYRRYAMPVLDSISTLDDIKRIGDELRAKHLLGLGFPTRLEFHPFQPHLTSINICFHAVKGEFDAALALFEALKPEQGLHNKPYHDVSYHRLVSDLLPALQARDIPRIAQVLHGWEEQSVHYLKIKKYWQPTPFDWE
jgi:hypothetical protein